MAHPNDFLIWHSSKFPEYTAPNGDPLADGWYFWYPPTEEILGPYASSAKAAFAYTFALEVDREYYQHGIPSKGKV